MSKISLAVVVVSYNVCAQLQECLRSIERSAARSAGWLAVETLVVDNASADGSAAMVAERFPHVRLIASDTNLGFTGGNNLAFHALGVPFADPAFTSPAPENRSVSYPDFVLLLNPDTIVEGDALGQMAAFLRDRPAAGAVGAHLRYGDGSFQHGAFRFPGVAQVALDLLPLADVPGLRRLLPALLNGPINGRYSPALWDGNEPFAVDFVLGAALMVRTAALAQVGPLDDDYFMYCEEMDWCLRLGSLGWPVFVLPTARITHLEAQSSRQSPWPSFERLWRSRYRYYRKHRTRHPATLLPFLRVAVHTALGVRAWNSRRKFAAGRLSGAELARELSAYRSVRQVWQ